VAVAVHADAEGVTLKVEDSGEGVPDEVLPQLGGLAVLVRLPADQNQVRSLQQ
jgi:hypothetical protein